MQSTTNRQLPSGSNEFPLLRARSIGDTIAWKNGTAINVRTFLHDVHALASRLPPAPHVINLCEDTYWFLVGFAALLVNRQTSLLPPNRASRVIEDIAADYPGTYCIHNGTPPDIDIRQYRIDAIPHTSDPVTPAVPLLPGEHVAAILFTSGSTGKPQPSEKYWGDLEAGARMKRERFGFGVEDRQQTIITTVPPQHMYGLETSILNTLLNGVSICTDRTFFPADIHAALLGVSGSRILVTTPMHLKSCIASALDWPQIESIISATAPLERELAEQAEDTFNCPVLEIYGCTETGSLATRRTIEGERWLLHEELALRQHANGHAAIGVNLPGDVQLQDVIEPVNDRQFILHGRHTDMIKIAGKRASLEDLNNRLCSIKGVLDGAFVTPEPDDGMCQRLGALVVAPSLDAAYIRRELSHLIDAAFLPRPLLLVEALPRNETGKLPRSALLELFRSAGNGD